MQTLNHKTSQWLRRCETGSRWRDEENITVTMDVDEGETEAIGETWQQSGGWGGVEASDPHNGDRGTREGLETLLYHDGPPMNVHIVLTLSLYTSLFYCTPAVPEVKRLPEALYQRKQIVIF